MQSPRSGFAPMLLAALVTTGLLLSAPALAQEDSCTITGTARTDFLEGTRDADVICGLAGSDFLTGKAGGDALVAGQGNDTVFGGRGGDTLLGGRGNDRLNSTDGVAGNDTVSGGTGLDVCFIDEGDTVSQCERVFEFPVA
jgi:Ca2+-binding RTX toxin-like protein